MMEQDKKQYQEWNQLLCSVKKHLYIINFTNIRFIDRR